MRRSIVCASVTCFFFAWAMVWPDVARAETSAAQAPADPAMASARQHFEAGRTAYNAGDFTTSIREFKAAEALRPSPILSYNIGLSNDKLGRRRVAVRYYRRYLETAPQAPNRAEVEGRISVLEQSIRAQPDGNQPVEPAATPQDDPPPPPPPDVNAPPPPTASAPAPDPYAPQAPILTARAPKRRWWIGLVIGLSVAVAVTAIVVPVAIIYTRESHTTYYPYDAKTPAPSGASLDRGAVASNAFGAQTGRLLELHF